MRILYNKLGAMASGSMLVSKTHITSAYKVAAPVIKNVPLLPEPHWTHLEKKIEVGDQSREYLLKENESLTKSLCHSRDIIHTHQIMEEHTGCTPKQVESGSTHSREQKKRGLTILFAEGYRQYLTSEESIGLVRDQKERKEK